VADIISHAGGNGGPVFEQISGVEPVRRIVGRNPSKADVEFYEVDDHRIACKTYAARNVLIRNTVGRWFISRESAAYEAASGVDGLAPFLGRVGPYTLATRWVDAEPLRAYSGDRLDPEVFDRLAKMIDDLHERGVAVGDLHHRDVLLGADGALYMVDLATALVLGRQPGSVRRYLFARFCESDRVNLARMRARFTGGDAGAMSGVSPSASAWHRRGRKIKGFWNRLRGKGSE
jgi:tRNA A-37 threonylcarbamoyl transferase component Bud32